MKQLRHGAATQPPVRVGSTACQLGVKGPLNSLVDHGAQQLEGFAGRHLQSVGSKPQLTCCCWEQLLLQTNRLLRELTPLDD